MEIYVSQEQGRVLVTVIHLDGELAGDTYQQLEGNAQRVISDGACYILLDMEKVSFVSSAGIRAMYNVFEQLRNLPDGEDEEALKSVIKDGKYKSRRLKLLKASDQVKRTLAITGLDMFMEFHNDLKSAVESF